MIVDRGLRPRLGQNDCGARTGSTASAFVCLQGSIYRRPGGVTDVAIERLDPRTGDGLTRSLLSCRALAGRTLHGPRRLRRGLRPAVLERVAGPIAIGDVAAASAVNGRVVGLGRDATIRLYAPTGDELSSLQITVDRPEQFDVTSGSEPMLLVMADQEIVGYSLAGDRISQVWRTGPVQVNEITDVGDHTYAVVQTVVAAVDGGPVRVVDTRTGAWPRPAGELGPPSVPVGVERAMTRVFARR